MEEKVLIISKINQKVKNFLKFAPIICIGIATLIYILLEIPGWNRVFDFGDYTIYFILFVLGTLCWIISIVLGIIFLVIRNCELHLTENNVKGKTLFGKEVILPLHMVSTYSTRKLLSTISIATSSGITKFALIENYAEIGIVLSQKIKEKQENMVQKTTIVAPQSNFTDDLKKLKDLLDAGIISQEEFDAKKKQLLGL